MISTVHASGIYYIITPQDLEHIWSRPEDLEDAQDAVAENAFRKAEALRAQAFRAQAAATQAAAAERMAVERAAAEKAAAEKAALDAEAAVEVPQSVVDLIVDLRAHLQDKCEPPVYVSDRRLVKSVALLRVAPAPPL